MTETIELFQNAVQCLKSAVDKMNNVYSLEGLLAAYFCHNYHPSNASEWIVYCDPSEWIKNGDIDFNQTPKLAVLGCLLHEEFRREGHISLDSATIFADNVSRLQQRQNIFQSPASWVHQPSIILGITLGVKASQQEKLRHWALDIIDQGLKSSGCSSFLKLTYLNAGMLLDGRNDRRLNTYIQSDISNYSVFELGYATWLVSKQMLIIDGEREKWLDDANSDIVFRLETEIGDWFVEENPPL
jgi:hypothetical protein